MALKRRLLLLGVVLALFLGIRLSRPAANPPAHPDKPTVHLKKTGQPKDASLGRTEAGSPGPRSQELFSTEEAAATSPQGRSITLRGRVQLPAELLGKHGDLDLFLSGREGGPEGKGRRVTREYPGVFQADGTYFIADLLPGDYALQISHHGRGVSEVRRLRVSNGTAPPPIADFDFQAEERGEISGSVIESGSGLPIPFARVQPWDELGVLTDAAGRFTLGGLPEGSVPLSVTHPRWEPASAALAVAEGRVTPVTVPMLPRASLVVTVKDVAGNAREQVNVTVQGRFGGQARVTNPSGQAVFGSLRSLDEVYSLTLTNAKPVGVLPPVQVVSGQTTFVDVLVQ